MSDSAVCRIPPHIGFRRMSDSAICRIPPHIGFRRMSDSVVCRIPSYADSAVFSPISRIRYQAQSDIVHPRYRTECPLSTYANEGYFSFLN
jgi:hypothetical protein